MVEELGFRGLRATISSDCDAKVPAKVYLFGFGLGLDLSFRAYRA